MLSVGEVTLSLAVSYSRQFLLFRYVHRKKKIEIGTQNCKGKKLAKAECLCLSKPGTIEESKHRPFLPMGSS